MSFKDKITKIFGDETLGEANAIKVKSPKKQKPKKESKMYVEIDDTPIVEPTSNVLSLLNIDNELDLGEIVVSKDIRNVEFTVTVPTGFDHDEVSKFLRVMEESVSKYEGALKQRNEDVSKLANEIKILEGKLIQSQQNMEFIEDADDSKEELIELTLDRDRYKQKSEQLERELKIERSKRTNTEEIRELKNQVELLKAKNSRFSNTQAAKQSEMPALDINKDEVNENLDFDEILNEIDGDD